MDGHDMAAILDTLARARSLKGRPVVIITRTGRRSDPGSTCASSRRTATSPRPRS